MSRRHLTLVALTAALAVGGAMLAGCGTTGDGAGQPTTAPGAGDSTSSTSTTTPVTASAVPPTSTAERPDACEGLARRDAAPVTADPRLVEISGAVVSQRTPGALWVHEDSGNEPVLIELGFDGHERSRWVVPGAQNIDWEDLAAAVDDDGVRHLFVGDVGDNRRVRSQVEVLRVPEPAEGDAGSTETPSTITLVHPVEPADVEALLVDPPTGDLVLLTKELSGISSLLVARGAAWSPDGTTIELEAVGTLRLGPGQAVLAADLSPSGDRLAVRTPFRVLLWHHSPDTPVLETLLSEDPCRAPAVFDPFGEAIALLDDGYVLVGEGERAELVIVR
jgi:hypothetical protein